MIMAEAIIGLETHVQLNTRTKLFCGCSIRDMNDEPNSRCCPTCLGMPGSKPRLNKTAIEAGIKIATALNCKIPSEFFFSRKTYFYPDMSKNFQITQYEVPLAKSGRLDTLDSQGRKKLIEIERINLEEDPAKLQHIGGDIITADYVLIDYNRSGIPLCEIVTKPQFSTSKEVSIFLQRLSTILEYLEVFVKGELSLKTDVNISIAGTERIEVKNVSSFEDIEKVIEYEIARQTEMVERGEKIERETRAWDTQKRKTKPLRKKETEEDYGYIFETDLTKIEIDRSLVNKIKDDLPEMPQKKFERYKKEYGLSSEVAYSITSDFVMANFYENAIKTIEPKFASSWMIILKKTLTYNDIDLKESKICPDIFSKLLKLIQDKKVTDRGGESILREMVSGADLSDDLIEKYSKIDSSDIESIINEFLKEESKAVESYRNGDEKFMKYLIGQLIKKSGRRIDGKTARELLEKKINK
jgi:aspartyl-tRNA(Asn)/glutamyl-tRNA(Gln) amidotransferase subunit B